MKNAPVIGITYSIRELSSFLLWRNMFEGVIAAGGIPFGIESAETDRDMAATVAHLDGLLLGGGGDIDPRLYGGDPTDPILRGINPVRDRNETAALQAARALGKPILAICRGAQLTNVVMGGTLHGDVARDLPTAVEHQRSEEALAAPLHEVTVAPDSWLATAMRISGPVAVNSQHHQGVRTLAPGLVATAHAPDGLVEAFESTTESIGCVQWHPEVMWPTDTPSRNLLSDLVARSAAAIARTELTSLA